MPVSAIAGVLFDLDGTLTAPGHIDFAGIRRDIACPEGLDILSHINQLEAHDPQAAARAWQTVERFEVEALAKVTPAPGVLDVLSALQEAAMPMGVLTRNSARTLHLTLERLGLAAFFPHRLAREDAIPKPHPDGVLSLAKALGQPPEHLLMVGDYVHDVTAGHAAGSWTAWLNVGQHGSAPDQADFVIGHLTEVLAIVQGEPRAWSPPVKISQRVK